MQKIIHCDCDCFYAAVEMRDNPALANIPLAIGGRSDRRGVISTCNYIAREFGIHSAMSSAQAMKRCPSLHLIPGNMQKYREVSSQIFDIYREVTDLIEPLSLDEAFLDVSQSLFFSGSATRIAQYLRQKVEREVGITISAGVAPNKFLAKIASDWNKPNGLKVIRPEDIEEFVEHLAVKKIPGVGKKTEEKMQALGINTCKDIRESKAEFLQQHFGTFGLRLLELSQGIDKRKVTLERKVKSVSVEHTFAQDINLVEDCLSELDNLKLQLTQRYLNLKYSRNISGFFVKVKFNDFTQTTAEQKSVAQEEYLFADLLKEAYSRGKRPVRLIGIGYRLIPEETKNYQQLSLLL